KARLTSKKRPLKQSSPAPERVRGLPEKNESWVSGQCAPRAAVTVGQRTSDLRTRLTSHGGCHMIRWRIAEETTAHDENADCSGFYRVDRHQHIGCHPAQPPPL